MHRYIVFFDEQNTLLILSAQNVRFFTNTNHYRSRSVHIYSFRWPVLLGRALKVIWFLIWFWKSWVTTLSIMWGEAHTHSCLMCKKKNKFLKFLALTTKINIKFFYCFFYSFLGSECNWDLDLKIFSKLFCNLFWY